MPRICIIGIGNTFMGDDAVGVRIAEELDSLDLGADARVVIGHLAGMQLTQHVLESECVIFVDAIDADDEAGSVFRFPAEEGLPNLRSHTSHGLSVPNIVMASRLAGSTAEITVYAVQVGQVGPSLDDLSPEVAAAVPDVVEMIVAEVTGRQAEAG